MISAGRFSGGAAEREASSKNWDKQMGQQIRSDFGAIFVHFDWYWVKALRCFRQPFVCPGATRCAISLGKLLGGWDKQGCPTVFFC